MIVFIKLLIAHFLSDFPLQPNSWVIDKQNKKEKSSKLYFHFGVHLVIMSLFLQDLKYWKGILIIALIHLVIDISKLYIQNESNKRILFFIDQFLHLLILLIVAEYYSPFIKIISNSVTANEILILILALLMLTNVSSFVIKILISKWTPENEDKDEESLSNAGNYIGMLERLFVFGFMITGDLQAIGFLLAAKSVFRFGDLRESKDRKLTEYILIGTLMSFGIAILIGILYSKMLLLLQ